MENKKEIIVCIDPLVIARLRELIQKKYGKLWGLQSHEIGLAIQDRIAKLETELGEGC